MRKRILAILTIILLMCCTSGQSELSKVDYQPFPIQYGTIITNMGNTANEIYNSNATFHAGATVFLIIDLSMYDYNYDTGTDIKDNALVILSNTTYIGINDSDIFVGGYYGNRVVIIKYNPVEKTAEYKIVEVSKDGEKVLEDTFKAMKGYQKNDINEINHVVDQLTNSIQ